MARTNTRTTEKFTEITHEGARTDRMTVEQALRRSVMSCLLWEDEFYEDGVEIGTRIQTLAAQLPPETVANIAIEAREVANLRHVSLWLLVALCKIGSGNPIVSETIARVIQRADELPELLALYWKHNGKDAALSKQLRLGLAKAFDKFDEYQLAKYNRDADVRLRDVLFLSHAKPATAMRADLYNRLANKTLATPDTWETNLSAGGDKKETFTRLLRESKLGYLALLRNLRNMAQAGVERSLVQDAIKARKGADRVLPFRYIAAARAAPSFEPALDEAMIASINSLPKFPGSTIILVDVSGSMDWHLSEKSDMNRIDAASALAAIFPGEDVRVFSFSTRTVEVPRRLGLAGIEAIRHSQMHGGTDLAGAVEHVVRFKADRLIVITDEQSYTRPRRPNVEHAYMINVASAQNGISYSDGWNHIDGFSENVIRWIAEREGVKVKPSEVSVEFQPGEAVIPLSKGRKVKVDLGEGSSVSMTTTTPNPQALRDTLGKIELPTKAKTTRKKAAAPKKARKKAKTATSTKKR